MINQSTQSIMTNNKFKLEASLEECIFALEQNNIDNLKQLLINNQFLLVFDSLENNKLMQQSIKFNNISAFHLMLELMNKVKNNIYISSKCHHILRLSELLSLAVDYSSHHIFIYLIKRFNLKSKDLSIPLIDRIFENRSFYIIDYLLNNTDFKYKVKRCYLFKEEIKSKEEDEFVYFNCDNESERSEAYVLADQNSESNKVIKDNFYVLGYFKTLKFFSAKHKSIIGLDFSESRQNKILKFMK